MEVPITTFENNREAAQAVRDYVATLHAGAEPFSLRPYQYQDPDFTHWWFFPKSGHWPAYRHSKLFIQEYRRHPKRLPDYLYAGFYVERGHGKQLLDFDPQFDGKLITKPEWYWFNFLRHAHAGELDAGMRETLARSRLPVTVLIDLWEYRDREDRYRGTRDPYDTVEFEVRSADLGFEPVKQSQDVLKRVNECANLQELAQRFDDWQELDWFWVNLFIGVKLRYGNEETGTWGASQLWRNALEPWAPWVH